MPIPSFDPQTLLADNRGELTRVPPQDRKALELYLLAKAAGVSPSFLKEQASQWLALFPSDRELASLAALRARAFDEVPSSADWKSLSKLISGISQNDFDGVKAYLQSVALARIQTQFSVDNGYDPLLGPPFAPAPYALYCDGRTNGLTHLRWTVPDIFLNVQLTGTVAPTFHLEISFPDYDYFPAKTTIANYVKRPTDANYVLLIGATNNASTDSGLTTAAMVDNGDNTSTITLSGGSYTFTPVDISPDGPGAVLHWDDGQEAVIVSITDGTHAIVNGGATKAAQTFTMYNNTPMVGFNPTIANSSGNGVPQAASFYSTFSATVNGAPRVLTSNLYPVTIPYVGAG